METMIWIGQTSTQEIFEQLAKKGYFHAPTYVAQRNIIEGIEFNTNNVMNSINSFMMPPFPKCPELITKKMEWSHITGAEDVSITNLNLPYADFIIREKLMISYGRKWAKKHINDKRVAIFVYTASEPYIKTALAIKKIIPKSEINLIITDLPLYMELNGKKIKRAIKKIMWPKLYKLIMQCDKYILFTKHMASYLELKQGTWMVMEGSVNSNEKQNTGHNMKNFDKKIVMYSGALCLKYGIPELLQAFTQIKDPDYELWLTGTGDAAQLVAETSKSDSRIKSYGFLPTRNDVLTLQNKATMLINTRMPTEKASAYCFPSKMFEYMLSGKPVLSFEIPGIPDEYYDYLIKMKSPNAEDIRQAILYVGSMSDEERNKIGRNGREFILNKKNNIIQTKRICDFVGLTTN